jgi:hypothetical protein
MARPRLRRLDRWLIAALATRSGELLEAVVRLQAS